MWQEGVARGGVQVVLGHPSSDARVTRGFPREKPDWREPQKSENKENANKLKNQNKQQMHKNIEF